MTGDFLLARSLARIIYENKIDDNFFDKLREQR
jgi:hypothetical protein